VRWLTSRGEVALDARYTGTVSTTQDETDELDADESERAGWPTFPLWKVIVLVAAFCFLAGAFGYWLAKPGPPGEGSVDAGFYKDMIYHHNQAIEMAVIEGANGSDPVVVGFATEIIRRQSFEIGIMTTKLHEWGYTTAPADTAMAWMGMPVPLDEMPGLATKDQMKQLRAAKGGAADALFLQLMSNHHRGGVHMATHAYEHAGNTTERDLAQLMAYVQATEINEFRDTAQRSQINVTIEPQAPTVPDPSSGR
jgi:uncharacterized protein (DUF305 family)